MACRAQQLFLVGLTEVFSTVDFYVLMLLPDEISAHEIANLVLLGVYFFVDAFGTTVQALLRVLLELIVEIDEWFAVDGRCLSVHEILFSTRPLDLRSTKS